MPYTLGQEDVLDLVFNLICKLINYLILVLWVLTENTSSLGQRQQTITAQQAALAPHVLTGLLAPLSPMGMKLHGP